MERKIRELEKKVNLMSASHAEISASGAELSAFVKNFHTNIQSLVLDKMESFETDIASLELHKEQAVKHQVAFLKQLADFRKDMELLSGTIDEWCSTVKSLDARIEFLELSCPTSDANSKPEFPQSTSNKPKNDECLENLKLKVDKLENESSILKVHLQSLTTPVCSFGTTEEFHQRKSKQNNLIIFGMRENEEEASTQQEKDKSEIEALLQDLNIQLDLNSVKYFRIGQSSPGKCRPIIIKPGAEAKAKILQNARCLKGNVKWQGVAITHDLTKLEYQQERAKEAVLQSEAKCKNSFLSEASKAIGFWKVIGGRGERRLAFMKHSS